MNMMILIIAGGLLGLLNRLVMGTKEPEGCIRYFAAESVFYIIGFIIVLLLIGMGVTDFNFNHGVVIFMGFCGGRFLPEIIRAIWRLSTRP